MAYNPALIPAVPSISALRNLPAAQYAAIFVEGYHSPGDGGGGFYISTNSVVIDNGGTIIASAAGGGFLLFNTGLLSVRSFGATGDGATDDTAAIQACWNTATAQGQGSYLPSGNYLVRNLTGAPATLVGDGHNSVLVAKAGTTGTLVSSISVSERNWENFRISSSVTGLIGLDTSWTAANPSIGGAFRYITVDATNSTQAWLATNNNDIMFDTVTCSNPGTGLGLSILAGTGSVYLNNPRMTAPLAIDSQQFEITGGGIILGLSLPGSSSNIGTVIGTQLATSAKLVDSVGAQCAVLNGCTGKPTLTFQGVFFIQGNGTFAVGQTAASAVAYNGLIFSGCAFVGTAGFGSAVLSEGLISPFGSGSPLIAQATTCQFGNITAKATNNFQWFLNAQSCTGSPNGGAYVGQVFAPVMSNGWVAANSSGYPAMTITRNGNTVHLFGTLTGGTTADGTVVFTLPVGLRPSNGATLSCVGFPAGGGAKPFQVFIPASAGGSGGAAAIFGVASASIAVLVFDNNFTCASS